MSAGWTHQLISPLVCQAERILEQRLARNLVIDPDLLGEPGWDILLCAFIAAEKHQACRKESLAKQLSMPPHGLQHWVTLLASRKMVFDGDLTVKITQRAKKIMRELLAMQMHDSLEDLGLAGGALEFSSGLISEGE